MFFIFSNFLWAQPPHTYNSNGSLYVPAGVLTMNVEAWGAGGSGGGASGSGVANSRSGSGGGGGAYVNGLITVIPGNTLQIKVAGIPEIGASGGNTTITSFETILFAAGGKSGIANTGTAPAGERVV
ncbi:hypothetical protein ACQ9BO_01455 [Flavobacterium sp. P21]|uniref:hypothetical protein n=1 Tax=Flavobacterium sp. P21 TaxID=3423948 RepID=UPI003D672E8F